jgi:hypothetical protein
MYDFIADPAQIPQDSALSAEKTVVLAVLIVGSIDRAGETCVRPGKTVASRVQR